MYPSNCLATALLPPSLLHCPLPPSLTTPLSLFDYHGLNKPYTATTTEVNVDSLVGMTTNERAHGQDKNWSVCPCDLRSLVHRPSSTFTFLQNQNKKRAWGRGYPCGIKHVPSPMNLVCLHSHIYMFSMHRASKNTDSSVFYTEIET